MDIDTATAPFTHTADCDALAIGRRVVERYRDGITVPVHPSALVEQVSDYPSHRQGCQCARLALSRIETQLRQARAMNRHAYHQDTANTISRLVAERTAIRNLIGA